MNPGLVDRKLGDFIPINIPNGRNVKVTQEHHIVPKNRDRSACWYFMKVVIFDFNGDIIIKSVNGTIKWGTLKVYIITGDISGDKQLKTIENQECIKNK